MDPTRLKALIADHDPKEARRLCQILEKGTSLEAGCQGFASFPAFEPESVDRLADVISRLNEQIIHVALVDVALLGAGGLAAFRAALGMGASCPIVLLGDAVGPGATVQAVRDGAQDYLVRGSADGDLLVRVVLGAVERVRASRAMAENHLEQGQLLLQKVLDTLPDSIYVKDAQSRYVIGNVAHTRFLGLDSDAQVRGTTIFDYFPPEQAQQFYADDQAVISTGQPLMGREELITRPVGQTRWVSTSKVPLRDAAGRIIGLVAISRDITERKLAEAQLREVNTSLKRREEELLKALSDVRASHEKLVEAQLQIAQIEKMQSVGRLAAGVAHEVKSPLGVVSMGLSYLDRSAPNIGGDGDREAAAVRQMMGDALRRADSVIRGLLDFSAPTRLNLQPRDLNQTIERSLSLVHHDLVVRRVMVEKDLAERLPLVPLDAPKMEQVFINLFTNAAHAMPGGGTLTVRTRTGRVGAGDRGAGGPDVADVSGGGNADWEGRFDPGTALVIVEADDTGRGIPEEALSKVFEPFFTTKPADLGTGLGLTVTKTIVDLHGGWIGIRNRPEGGARVTVALKTG